MQYVLSCVKALNRYSILDLKLCYNSIPAMLPPPYPQQGMFPEMDHFHDGDIYYNCQNSKFFCFVMLIRAIVIIVIKAQRGLQKLNNKRKTKQILVVEK